MMQISNRMQLQAVVLMLSLFAAVNSNLNAASAGTIDTVAVLIANPPPKDSPDYMVLVDIAGEPPTRTLELTKCEVWKVPADKVKLLEQAAHARGSIVTRLGEDWNNMFQPTTTGVGMTRAQSKMLKEAMGSTAAAGAIVMDSPASNVFEYALTKDMFSNVKAGVPSEITIPLREGLTVTAQRLSVTQAKDKYVWRGVIKNRQNIVTLMWWPSGRISGTVRHDDRVYVIKHIGGRRHCVVELVPGLMPPEHASMPDAMKRKMKMDGDPLVKHGDMSMVRRMPEPSTKPEQAEQSARAKKIDSGDVTISLLVAYTSKAANHYTDIENDLIALAIEDANQSFRNSGVKNVALKLASAVKVGYSESGSHFDHLYGLLVEGDDILDDVQALRNTHQADVAILIVHDPQGCGLAAKVGAEASRAFAVVHHECAMHSYSLAHEIGHIIGARHDTALDDSNEPFSYGHGFINGTKWRTMMSYKDSCNNCPRVPSWSNPNTIIDGVRAGNAMSNNARVIREQAARVAAFR